jgi:hypothetical protein
MDLNGYLLDGVVDATTPPNETEAAARIRADAIVEMVCAFDPRDAMETMIACHCVMLQFLLNAAMRAACDVRLAPAVMAKNRAAVTSTSRTLHQWVTKFEKIRKRNATSAAEMREADQLQSASVPSEAPVAVESPVSIAPVTPPSAPAILAPLPGSRTGNPIAVSNDALIAAARPSSHTSAVRAGDRRITG